MCDIERRTMDHSYASLSNISNSKPANPSPAVKPLTERQQMALLLQMTAESSPVSSTRSNSPNTTPKSLVRRNERGETPLHVAAIRGDIEKVRRLIRQGVDVNTTDFAGWSPLHEAANRGHTSVVKELLLAGALVNAAGLDSVTPLHDAAVNGHELIVSLLLRHGANANMMTAGNKTALDLAASPEIVNLLARGTSDHDASFGSDENSPLSGRSNPGAASNTPWRVRQQAMFPPRKSRRNLIMPTGNEDSGEEPSAGTDSAATMESGTIPSSGSSAEDKESKSTIDGKVSLNSGTQDENVNRDETRDNDGSDSTAAGQKRTMETEEETEEETRRKRKKGEDSKEGKSGRGLSARGKQADRKSPNTIQSDSNHSIPESDEDGRKANELKVPPLKIVLSSNTTEADAVGARAKSSNGRGSLPYVVASSEEKTESSTSEKNEKDEKPRDCMGDSEKSVTTGGRVTRSSQRAAATANTQATPTTSGPNSANQSPTCSPVQSATASNANTGSPAPATDPAEPPAAAATAATSAPVTVKEQVKAEEVKAEEPPVEVHPRKRKLRVKEPEAVPEPPAANQAPAQPEPAAQAPMTNCYDMYFSIRKQIERRHRNLIPVQPKPPQGFKDYLMNRCTYVIASNSAARLSVPVVSPPPTLPPAMRDLFAGQEKERYRLRMQHLIEKEKLVLSVEQEILRVHGRAARALANQSLPFSVCTLLKDQEVYSALTPEQEEKDRNARSRYNGRLFLSWLQDVDDKWEKIKDSMLLRHHNEAESLHAVQKMDWEWKLKELALCDPQTKPVIEELHVPMVHVSDDFDLLPA